MTDGNAVKLGTLVSASSTDLVIRTSTGYLVDIGWDGTMYPGQIYYSGYSGGTCSGSALLNSGGTGTANIPMYGKWLVWSGSLGQYMAPANVTNGYAKSAGGFSSAGIDNPTCGADAGTQTGWLLTAVTPTAAGLPATIAAPLALS